MKASSLIAALSFALLGAGTAQAQSDAPVQKTRAEVAAETLQARDRGTLNVFGEGATNVDVQADAGVAKTRAQVVAETQQARERGELSVYGEGDVTVPFRQAASSKSRAEVRAETVRALHDGALQSQWTQG